jgi:hypothetical protein
MLIYGAAFVIGVLLFYRELEQRSAASEASASAQAYADTTVYAELGQQAEETNIPAMGQLPITEAPQTGLSATLPVQTNPLILASYQTSA